MIFRADAREEEEEPHILERGRSDGMEDKVSPYQAASLVIPPVYICLKKHYFLTVLWENIGVLFFIFVIINHSHEP